MGSMSALLRTVLLVCVAVSLSTAFTCTPSDFAEFRGKYNRHYATPEEAAHRFAVFCDNMAHADKLNHQNPTARFGSTKFSDLTKEEFRRNYLGLRVPKDLPAIPRAPAPPAAPPSSYDWRNYKMNVLTPIKNQLQCGSCWAFSATEVIETMFALAGYGLPVLAPQQLVDCDTSDGGCNGGWPYNAINYVMAKGQEAEADYPYLGTQGTCQYKADDVKANVSGWQWAGQGNENDMAANLASTGPLSVCVDAQQWSSYQGGILKGNMCGDQIDHAVVAVGYDMNAGYWTIRNSWGADWGEQGYIRIEFGTNACDITSYPLLAIK